MFIVDAHLDLSMNATEWNRDLTQSLADIRAREKNMKDKADRGNNTVCFEELRKGNIGLVVATQIARYVAADNPLPGWHSPAQAWAHTQGQLAWYKAMEAQGELRMIRNKTELAAHISYWNEDSKDQSQKAIGYILSLEGADSMIDLSYLHTAHQYGLRALGPAHYGPGRYAHGTDASSPLNADGKALIREMEKLNIILDATHLCDLAFWDALEIFNGPVWASHNNCRSIVNHNRQFSDDQLKELISRKAVIGAAFDSWMIVPDWVRGKSDSRALGCNLDRLIDHIVHICDLAGNVDHVGIGSDLDGGFGTEQSPYDIQSIADHQTIPGRLAARAFTSQDIAKIMSKNWLDFLERNLG
ncbi:MAG: dipeptidase [Saprospiraceae bacterium]|nr:dipeptidase [Saprospiraceae bacterium]